MATQEFVKVADEVWIATALLHREHPDREGFPPKDIVDRLSREGIVGRVRPGVSAHISAHCVADRPPQPGCYRMLVIVNGPLRRLFRPGDPFHPDRRNGKIAPEPQDIPERYRGLLTWFAEQYCHTPTSGGASAQSSAGSTPIAALLAARGIGKSIAGTRHPDRDVRELRAGWS